MSYRMITRGANGADQIAHYSTPVELEMAYLRGCLSIRTDGPAAIFIPAAPGVPASYYRLDREWDPQASRESEPERIGLWTDTATGYQMPTPSQLRAAARLLGESGLGMARRLGIGGRQWRYYLASGRKMPFTEWFYVRDLLRRRLMSDEGRHD